MEDKFLKNMHLYRLKSMLLQRFYNIKLNNKKGDIFFLMRKYIDNLKEVDLLYTRADIESRKYDYTSYPDTLLKSEITNRFCFYSIVLGFIDSNIDNLNKYINLSKINNIKNLTYYKNELINLYNFREMVLNDFNKTSHFSDPKLCVDTLNTFLCYKNFNNCYSYISTSIYTDTYVLDLINSYNIGYKHCNKYTIYDIYENYIFLITELNEYKNNNINKVKKVKTNKYN